MRKQIIYSILFFIILMAAIFQNQWGSVPALAQGNIEPTIVVDAGHGGEDGGAVSLSGTPESEINLSIASKLESLLVLYGVPTQMTRTEDISLHDSDAVTLREKKRSDLRNRVSFIKDIEHPILISIHQNSYQDSRYRGAQVFFTDVPGSEVLAKQLQNTLNSNLNDQNNRKPHKVSDTVYLFQHIECPAALVECGFLTNPEEEQLLRQDEYQKKLSVCLAGAILTAPNPYDQL